MKHEECGMTKRKKLYNIDIPVIAKTKKIETKNTE